MVTVTQVQRSATPVIDPVSGLWTYVWETVGQGFIAQVSVSVPGAPPSTTWTVYIAGQMAASVGGSLTAGPFTVGGGQALSMTGTPGSSILPIPAIMMGQVGPPGSFPNATPLSPGASSVPSASSPVTIVNPAAGTDWQYLLPAPGRLLAIEAVLITSAGGGNRYPFLVIPETVAAPMSAAAIIGGTTTLFFGYAAGPTTPVLAAGTVGGTPVWNFSFFLNVLLPIGTGVETLTEGLAAGDQWEDIYLTFGTV